MNFPIMPLIRDRGKNAAKVVSTANVTGMAISLAPWIAASSMDIPSRCSLYAFSPITIASSTTIPKVMISANRVIILIDTSAAGRNTMDPKKASGIPNVTQKASRISRNSPRIKKTRMNPHRALFKSRSIRCCNVSDQSLHTAICMPGGSSGFMCFM